MLAQQVADTAKVRIRSFLNRRLNSKIEGVRPRVSVKRGTGVLSASEPNRGVRDSHHALEVGITLGLR